MGQQCQRLVGRQGGAACVFQLQLAGQSGAPACLGGAEGGAVALGGGLGAGRAAHAGVQPDQGLLHLAHGQAHAGAVQGHSFVVAGAGSVFLRRAAATVEQRQAQGQWAEGPGVQVGLQPLRAHLGGTNGATERQAWVALGLGLAHVGAGGGHLALGGVHVGALGNHLGGQRGNAQQRVGRWL